jgi:proline dehydrogenase
MLASILKHFHVRPQPYLQRVASRVDAQADQLRPPLHCRETIADAIDAARALHERGLLVTLDHLSENVTNLAEADAATRDYLAIVEAIVRSGIDRNISLKLSGLGLDVDKERTVDNLREVLERAEPAGFFVRLDMESSHYTEITLEIMETLWRRGHRALGIVLQAALRRSERDLQRLNSLGVRVRLVKGAYTEARSIAYQKKADVDAAFERMMTVLIAVVTTVMITGTNAECMIEKTRRWAAQHGVTPDPSSSRCCTVCGGISSRGSPPTATACVSTCPTAVNGSRTSCGGWENGRPISGS